MSSPTDSSVTHQLAGGVVPCRGDQHGVAAVEPVLSWRATRSASHSSTPSRPRASVDIGSSSGVVLDVLRRGRQGQLTSVCRAGLEEPLGDGDPPGGRLSSGPARSVLVNRAAWSTGRYRGRWVTRASRAGLVPSPCCAHDCRACGRGPLHEARRCRAATVFAQQLDLPGGCGSLVGGTSQTADDAVVGDYRNRGPGLARLQCGSNSAAVTVSSSLPLISR